MQVSWLKRHGDTPHLLTFGLTTYSNDARIQIFHEQPNDWKLQIQFPRLDDEGVYECLVSANPTLVKRVRLVIVGNIILYYHYFKFLHYSSYHLLNHLCNIILQPISFKASTMPSHSTLFFILHVTSNWKSIKIVRPIKIILLEE